jgi:hypothetical protein
MPCKLNAGRSLTIQRPMADGEGQKETTLGSDLERLEVRGLRRRVHGLLAWSRPELKREWLKPDNRRQYASRLNHCREQAK